MRQLKIDPDLTPADYARRLRNKRRLEAQAAILAEARTYDELKALLARLRANEQVEVVK